MTEVQALDLSSKVNRSAPSSLGSISPNSLHSSTSPQSSPMQFAFTSPKSETVFPETIAHSRTDRSASEGSSSPSVVPPSITTNGHISPSSLNNGLSTKAALDSLSSYSPDMLALGALGVSPNQSLDFPPIASPLTSYLVHRKRRAEARLADCEAKKLVKPVPDEKKDEAYWERRRKNNEAAKRSRDSRRQKEEAIGMRAAFLEQENLKLRAQVALLKNETTKLHYMLYSRV